MRCYLDPGCLRDGPFSLCGSKLVIASSSDLSRFTTMACQGYSSSLHEHTGGNRSAANTRHVKKGPLTEPVIVFREYTTQATAVHSEEPY